MGDIGDIEWEIWVGRGEDEEISEEVDGVWGVITMLGCGRPRFIVCTLDDDGEWGSGGKTVAGRGEVVALGVVGDSIESSCSSPSFWVSFLGEREDEVDNDSVGTDESSEEDGG